MRVTNIPANSFEAAALSVDFAESGDRRLLLKRMENPATRAALTNREWDYLTAYVGGRLGPRRRGHPECFDKVKLWIVCTAFRFEAGRGRSEQVRVDRAVSDKAKEYAAEIHGITKRTVESHVRFAAQYKRGA